MVFRKESNDNLYVISSRSLMNSSINLASKNTIIEGIHFFR